MGLIRPNTNLDYTVVHHFQVNSELVPSLLLQQGEQLPGTIYYKLMGQYFITRRNVLYFPKAFPCVNQQLVYEGLSLLEGHWQYNPVNSHRCQHFMLPAIVSIKVLFTPHVKPTIKNVIPFVSAYF